MPIAFYLIPTSQILEGENSNHVQYLLPKFTQTKFRICIAIRHTLWYNMCKEKFACEFQCRARSISISKIFMRDVYTNSRKMVHTMATKTANVTARVSPEIKQQAEEVLEQLGIPVSVLIDSLYRQIIMTNSIPYSFSVPALQTRDSMTDAQFNTMMAKGLSEAKAGQGVDVEDAFAEINKSI